VNHDVATALAQVVLGIDGGVNIPQDHPRPGKLGADPPAQIPDRFTIAGERREPDNLRRRSPDAFFHGLAVQALGGGIDHRHIVPCFPGDSRDVEKPERLPAMDQPTADSQHRLSLVWWIDQQDAHGLRQD